MKRKTIIGVLFSLLVLSMVGLYYTNVPKLHHALEHGLTYSGESIDDYLVDAWLHSYFDKRNDFRHGKNQVKEFEIVSIEDMNNGFYHVVMDLELKKEPLDGIFKNGRNDLYMKFYSERLVINNDLFGEELVEYVIYLSDVLDEAGYRLELIQYVPFDDYISDEPNPNVLFKSDAGYDGSMTLFVSVNSGRTWIDTEIPLLDYEEIHQGTNRYFDDSVYYENGRLLAFYGENRSKMKVMVLDGGTSTEWKVYETLPFQNPVIVSLSESKLTLLEIKDAAMGSRLWHLSIYDLESGNLELINDNIVTREIAKVRRFSDSMIYIEEQGDVLYESVDGGESFHPFVIPKHDDVIEGYYFDEIYTFAKVPFIDEGGLSIYITQGDQGDVAENKYAKFHSKDMGKSWEFVGYEPAYKKPQAN